MLTFVLDMSNMDMTSTQETEIGLLTVVAINLFNSKMWKFYRFVCRICILGICVEALCSPTSIQPLATVNQCLKAIYCLLDDPWPREKLGSEQALAIELLNVLHRLLLTRDSTECFLLVMRVVSQVVKAAQENLQMEKEKHAAPGLLMFVI